MEIWKPVVGFEGLYEVSDLGRVRGVDRPVRTRGGKTRIMRGQIIKPQRHSQGYTQVGMRGRTYPIHHLVAAAFLGPRPESMQIAHFDGDKTNNTLANLRYATPKQNAGDRIRHGRSGLGASNSQAKLTVQKVVRIRLAAQGGVPQDFIAQKFGISQQQVSKIATRQRWAHV